VTISIYNNLAGLSFETVHSRLGTEKVAEKRG